MSLSSCYQDRTVCVFSALLSQDNLTLADEENIK